MSDALMTGKELQVQLQISRATVRRLVKQGRLTARRISPGAVRYKRADVDRLIEESENRQR